VFFPLPPTTLEEAYQCYFSVVMLFYSIFSVGSLLEIFLPTPLHTAITLITAVGNYNAYHLWLLEYVALAFHNINPCHQVGELSLQFSKYKLEKSHCSIYFRSRKIAMDDGL